MTHACSNTQTLNRLVAGFYHFSTILAKSTPYAFWKQCFSSWLQRLAKGLLRFACSINATSITHTHTHTHTHNHFTALWTLPGTTRVSWYQKVRFAVFSIFWCKMKITQADTPTIRMDCHPIQTNWCPHLCRPHHFTPDVLPDTTLPIYPGSGQAPTMLACTPGGLLLP